MYSAVYHRQRSRNGSQFGRLMPYNAACTRWSPRGVPTNTAIRTRQCTSHLFISNSNRRAHYHIYSANGSFGQCALSRTRRRTRCPHGLRTAYRKRLPKTLTGGLYMVKTSPSTSIRIHGNSTFGVRLSRECRYLPCSKKYRKAT